MKNVDKARWLLLILSILGTVLFITIGEAWRNGQWFQSGLHGDLYGSLTAMIAIGGYMAMTAAIVSYYHDKSEESQGED